MRTTEQRFWSYVLIGDGCWEWQGGTKTGASRKRPGRTQEYGQFWNPPRNVRAHRYCWELFNGPIADGLTLDHLCENTLCVRPDHLRLATHKQNINRSTKNSPALQRAKTHCPRGHEYTAENTRLDKPSARFPSGQRHCIICAAAASRRARERKKGAPLRPYRKGGMK